MRYIQVAIAVCALVVSAQTPREGRDHQNQASKNADGGDNGSPALTQPARQPGVPTQKTQEEPHKCPEQNSGYWKQAFGPTVLATWALVAVGGGAGVLAWGTLRAIHKQGEIAARAERPWVTVTAPDAHKQMKIASGSVRNPFVSENGLSVRIRNRGKSVARITRADVSFVYVGIDGIDFLPQEPQYNVPEAWPQSDPNQIVAPGDFFIMNVPVRIADWIEAVDGGGTLAGQHFIYAYGFVDYTDSHENPHITRFGLASYVAIWGDERSPSHCPPFRANGPSAYNEAT